LAKFFSFLSSKSNLLKSILLFHIGPDHGGPGHKVGQHSSLAEALPMTLVACLTTGNDLSFRGRGGDLSLGGSGGKLTHTTTVLSKFDHTVLGVLGVVASSSSSNHRKIEIVATGTTGITGTTNTTTGTASGTTTGSTTGTNGTMGTTGTELNIVRSNDGSSGRARSVNDDVGTATASGHTLQCTTGTLGVLAVIKTIGDVTIKHDCTIGTNCNAAAAAVNMEGTTPIAAAEAVSMQQRVKKKEYGHIGPNYGGPGHEFGQHFSLAEAVPMTLAACLTTGNDLSVRDRGGGAVSGCDRRGGESTHATAAPGVFDSTTSDATNNQVDPSTNVEGKAQSRKFWIDFEVFSRLFQ
jgi:hypothetical protein